MSKKQTEMKEMKKQTSNEWLEEGKELFGENFIDWKFVCPACGKVNCVQEFKDAGSADPNDAWQICIGRVNGKGISGLKSDGKNNQDGCDWAAFGFFGTLSKGRIVITPEGKEVEAFDFAVDEALKPTGELHPCNGGCWFCHDGIDGSEDKAFSVEFDTNLHISCLMKELKYHPDNDEAKMIAKEYGIDYNK